MGMWVVWNGWLGESSTGALVEAADQDAAIKAGSAALRAVAETPRSWGGGGPTYPASYWEPDRLTAEQVSLPLVGGFDI